MSDKTPLSPKAYDRAIQLTREIQSGNREASSNAMREVLEIQKKSPSEGKKMIDTIKTTNTGDRQQNPFLPEIVIVGEDKPRIVGVMKKDAQRPEVVPSTTPAAKPVEAPRASNREYNSRQFNQAFTDVFLQP